MENILFRHAGKIAFGDTDASGWMHFSKIFTYVEIAEHAFLRSRGVVVYDKLEGGWPRVKVTCDYKRPFLQDASFEVLLSISRIGSSSIVWDFEVINADGEVAAFGSMTNVRLDNEGRPKSICFAERDALT